MTHKIGTGGVYARVGFKVQGPRSRVNSPGTEQRSIRGRIERATSTNTNTHESNKSVSRSEGVVVAKKNLTWHNSTTDGWACNWRWRWRWDRRGWCHESPVCKSENWGCEWWWWRRRRRRGRTRGFIDKTQAKDVRIISETEKYRNKSCRRHITKTRCRNENQTGVSVSARGWNPRF